MVHYHSKYSTKINSLTCSNLVSSVPHIYKNVYQESPFLPQPACTIHLFHCDHLMWPKKGIYTDENSGICLFTLFTYEEKSNRLITFCWKVFFSQIHLFIDDTLGGYIFIFLKHCRLTVSATWNTQSVLILMK